MATVELLADDLQFGESPRWHDGALWFSDMEDRAVKTIDDAGKIATVVEVPNGPGGLGWLPDGTLLVVSMFDLTLRRFDGRELSVHADLSGIGSFAANDMAVSAAGRAYVGDFGFDVFGAFQQRSVPDVLADHRTASIAIVDADGRVRTGATDMHFPNGAVITPDGAMLIVAESLSASVTAFDIAADGSLHNRRLWAQPGQRMPDGICLDVDGHIWVANPGGNECVLIAEGGDVLDVVLTEKPCFACALGGPDGRTLFMMTANQTEPGADRDARVVTTRVASPAAG